MDYLLLIVWLLVTVGPGALLLQRQIPAQQAGRPALVLGYGIIMGLMLIPLGMRLLNLTGMPFSLAGITAVSLVMAIIAYKLPRFGGIATPLASELRMGLFGKLVLALCLALIGLRLLSLGLEVSLRPVYAWDSKQHWGKQAKVLFELRQIAPYVSLSEWLELAEPGAYTNMHPDYPVTVPLLQAWANIPWRDWHDSRMNFPWLLTWVGLGLVCYGQLRSAGGNKLVAVAASYMVLSLPYLNIQVALAGYADLIMSACFFAALASFCNWHQHRQPWQGLLALFFALSLPMIKHEGFYWALSLLPGLVVSVLGLNRGFKLGAVLLVALAILLLLLPGDLVIAGYSLDNLRLSYHPESWSSLLQSFFLHDNWHLLAYLLPALVFAAALFRREIIVQIAPGLVTISCALILYLTLYLLTRHSHGAINFTSLNRVALQLMPAFGFIAALLYVKLEQLQTHPIPPESAN